MLPERSSSLLSVLLRLPTSVAQTTWRHARNRSALAQEIGVSSGLSLCTYRAISHPISLYQMRQAPSNKELHSLNPLRPNRLTKSFVVCRFARLTNRFRFSRHTN